MVVRQGEGAAEYSRSAANGSRRVRETRRISWVDFWPGHSSRRWISRRCSAPPRGSLSGRSLCRCWTRNLGSNGSRSDPDRRRMKSHEVYSSGRRCRRTRHWPEVRWRTLARPRRRVSPRHEAPPPSAIRNQRFNAQPNRSTSTFTRQLPFRIHSDI